MRTCADCSKECDYDDMYQIVGPENPKYHKRRGEFWLCIPCWDCIVGAATMQAIR